MLLFPSHSNSVIVLGLYKKYSFLVCPTFCYWSSLKYFSDFLAWHLYHLTSDLDVTSVPVVAVTSFILAWFQSLGKGSGKRMTSVICVRWESLRCHISCEDELMTNEASLKGWQEARSIIAEK